MDGFRDGIVGFALFVAQWLSPETSKAKIDANYIRTTEKQEITYRCKFDIAWNRQLEQLVDAGIPLRFHICHFTDKSDTVSFIRALYFNIVDYTYNFTDSSSGQITKSSSYSLVHLALRDFTKWDITIPRQSTACRIDIIILPSRAEQMNRIVDMSRVWGQQRVFYVFNPQESQKRKK
jgi:hypothetical protein